MRSRSGSAASISSKELATDSVAIQVTSAGGKVIKLNVRPVHTVSNVLEFLCAPKNIPSDARLMLNGEPLEVSTTVGELKLEESSILQLQTPSRSTTPTDHSEPQPTLKESANDKPASTSAVSTPTASGTATPTKRKSNKPRCSKDGCKAPAQPIVGDCGFCQKRFCGKHRMLESHNCEGLEDARRADKDRNTAKLEGERTVMLRGL
ncbi:hypothetical protein A1O1_06797 [Capronia coronata CBS 617.96]|uniref:AN1-type domain-containing protein n=1 Tax=Capronia coronata CBS 617.96 TaxID=1182541 RepID=W9XSG4_9EURO|nr:uncharacterized protein A1O1_06797 [Capronia coronata CBS 617.96]EXJ83178.1 hypothetical protein A1O1_06797 [Capronia coronata CBS 617.96]